MHTVIGKQIVLSEFWIPVDGWLYAAVADLSLFYCCYSREKKKTNRINCKSFLATVYHHQLPSLLFKLERENPESKKRVD